MSKNIGIEQNTVKQKLISYVKDKINFKCQEIPLMEHHLNEEILVDKYVVIPDINGEKFLLVFIEIETVMYSFIAILNGNYLDIKKVDIPAKASIYKGTIISGKYLSGVISSAQLNDIYYYKGSCLINFNYTGRFEKLKLILDDKEIINSDNFLFYLTHFTKINKTNLLQLLSKTIERTDFTKWMFFPENYPSKKRHCYVYQLQDGDRINNPQTIHKMEMKKSKTADIYYLTDLDTGVTDIASIKQSEKSHLYRSWFKNTDKRIIKCIHDVRDNSWQPIDVIDNNI